MRTYHAPRLALPVGPHDHARGDLEAPVTLVEYGDYECPYCGAAHPMTKKLIAVAPIRFVFRHFPITTLHPHAELAAEAAEAAGAQGKVWEVRADAHLHLRAPTAHRAGGSRRRRGPPAPRCEALRGRRRRAPERENDPRQLHERGPQRGQWDADLLHQRRPPRWRLRAGGAARSGPGGGARVKPANFRESSVTAGLAYVLVHARDGSMRLLASLIATALLAAACGGTRAAPSPTVAPTTAPTATPAPTPQLKYTFLADLKTSNEVPAIADAEASCAGKGNFTLHTTKDATGAITAARAQFDLTITGCPANTNIILFHIHKAAAGANGGVVR